jgi:hypothetical protein
MYNIRTPRKIHDSFSTFYNSNEKVSSFGLLYTITFLFDCFQCHAVTMDNTLTAVAATGFEIWWGCSP